MAEQERGELAMETIPIFTDEELSAFIDGELDEARTEQVAAAVEASAELSARIEAFAADKDMIARIYGPLIDLPVPAALVRAATGERRHAPAARSPMRFFPAVMALAAALAVAVISYPTLSNLGGDPLVAQAIAVRSGEIHPDRQFADTEMASAATRDHLVQAALSVPVKVPNLEKAGYTLAGITAYPDRGGHQALQISYRDRNGGLFTLYMRQTGSADRFELSRKKDMQVCVWQNDNLSVVMLGTMPAHEMLRVATATYADLDF
jgi:anti-sigma factor RsiW